MMPMVEMLAWLSAAAFVAVAVLAVRGWSRRRVPDRVALAWALVLLACVPLAVQVQSLLGDPQRWLAWCSMAAFIASGYAIVLYRHAVLPMSLRFRGLAGLACLVVFVAGVTAGLPLEPGTGLSSSQGFTVNFVIAVWAGCVLEPIVRFASESRHRPPVEKARLRLLSGGLLGVFLVIVWAVAVVPTVRHRPAHLAFAEVLSMPFIPLLYLAASPPQRLSRRWLRRAGEVQARSLARLGAWYWDVSADIVYWSSEMRIIFGDETLADMSMRDALRRMHPDDADMMTRLLAQARDDHRPLEAEYRIITSDGTVRWLHTTGQVVTDPSSGEVAGMFGTSQDITRRKEAETKLAHTSRSLAEAQRLARVGSWQWDESTDTATWTDELYRVFGLESASCTPSFEAYISRVHPDFREEARAAVSRTVSEGRPFDHSHKILRPDNQTCWVHARGEPEIDRSGRVVAYRGICHDITERKLAEEALLDALRREREAADRLRSLDDMKDSMLAAVSHELRTPLTVVIGLASTLRHPNLENEPARAREIVTALEINAYRLEKLLTDLLDLDRMQRGVIEPRRRPTEMTALIFRVLETLDIADHPVWVESGDWTANIDTPRTERIIENLVANAMKHTPSGTVIRLAVSQLEAGVLIQVEDGGPGVPDDMKESIFHPFTRGAGPSHAPGTGIGLSLVSKFAELHGGRAWVEDAVGGGASFKVLLPESGPVPGPEIDHASFLGPARGRRPVVDADSSGRRMSA